MKALDLFCGAGGATKGLQQAGFHVTGVDINAQPRYCGDDFIQADATTWGTREHLRSFDLVWASPPCQGYSRMSGCREDLQAAYAKLIPLVRRRLRYAQRYIIENVVGAPLENPILLCGAMFGARTYRHRLFEASVAIQVPGHPPHTVKTSKAGHWKPGTFVSVAGHCSPIAECRAVMEIDWMNREELAEAIPPYFSRYIGEQIARVCRREAA